MRLYFLLLLFIASIAACTKLPSEDSLLDGPVEGLTNEENLRFLRGDAAFNDEVFTSATGLGPLFVATSCGSCHAGDGKGHPFTALTRFGQSDETGNQFMNMGAPQLQHRALPGFKVEEIPGGATFSKFMPPANTGLGYLELVSDADLLAIADPDDLNGDGISGVPNWNTVPDYAQTTANNISQGGKYICRFGKKGSVFNLLQQTANAYNQDIGITSLYEPYDTYTKQEIDPEIPTQRVLDVVHYLQTLKAPIQREQNNEVVKSGRQLFLNAGCENCHKETLKTGASPIQALAYKEFHPYTDLLLHDMGSALDDGYTEGTAKTYEWRTPALWGIGLSPNSQGGQYYLMHDGRAHTLNDAIMLHGGEATGSQQKYSQMNEADKQKLIKFLESL